ncbi:MAG: hypothetical protein NTZ56_22075 [Acidobacteria bacterium]|nr:hypothetical protein [Acidobacteriota bacterium]
MTAVAIFNFRSVEAVLEEPANRSSSSMAHDMVKRLGGKPEASLFLRHHVAEQNRFYFENWGLVQIGLGLTLFAVLLFGSGGSKLAMGLTLAMVALVSAAQFFVLPPIIGLGREVDFVPKDVPNLLREQLKTWHSTYSALEITKLLIGLGLMGNLIVSRQRRRGSSGSSAEELEPTTIPDVRHRSSRS